MTTTLQRKAASTQTQSSQSSGGNKFQSIAKRKLEKIKNKFVEFFLSNKQQTKSNSLSNSNLNSQQSLADEISRKQQQQQEEKCMLLYNDHLLSSDLSYIPHNAVLFSNIYILNKFHAQFNSNSDGTLIFMNIKNNSLKKQILIFR